MYFTQQEHQIFPEKTHENQPKYQQQQKIKIKKFHHFLTSQTLLMHNHHPMNTITPPHQHLTFHHHNIIKP